VVYSPATYAQACHTLEQQVQAEQAAATRALERLHGHEFATPEAVAQAVAELNAQWGYHQGQVQTQPVPHYGHPGRPRKGETPERVGCRVTASSVTLDEAALAAKRQTLGKFVLATNELNPEKLSVEELLHAYKGQAGGVERGFRFLKDPWFFADSLFLKKPERIMAMMMVMGLSLLIYALTERKLRQALQAQAVTIPDQVGKPTQRPTLRRVFQMFEGIDVLLIHQPDAVERRVLNLSEVHQVILRLLGPDIQRCYLIDI
jgi:transposase